MNMVIMKYVHHLRTEMDSKKLQTGLKSTPIHINQASPTI